jgi:type II secretory ATPase GspE/PulE/Tfp pilus assembly ATPase PilB-like protein
MNDTARTDDVKIDVQINVNNLPAEEGVAALIDHAAELGVSDLFYSTNEHHVNVSARHLGLLCLITVLPGDLGRRHISHIKALAGMDVAERRRPLDGRWLRIKKNAPKVDLRISTLPTLHGEDCTLRFLVREAVLLSLEDLGLMRKEYNQLMNLLNSPSGLILVTGPTGAGKTTTLYACLNHLNTGKRRINTIEDPIEYAIEGIRQSQINPKLELDFPDLLRSVLRQGPDIIMVGEIRDPVTAETAVRAANSGHLVLATLHAPIAAGAIQSMLALGVNSHFLANSLRGVIAQRLLRTLCPACKLSFDLSLAPDTFAEVQKWLEPGQGQLLYGARGCPKCRQTGYLTRTGVFELLTVTREIRRLLQERQPTQVIRQKAIEEGMMEFRHAAMVKVARGETNVEEVLRVVPTEYLGLDD